MIGLQELRYLGLLMICLAIFGCDKKKTEQQINQGDFTKQESLQEQVETLKAEIFVLKEEVERLTSGKSFISTSDKGYSIAQTKHGAFAIVCRNVTPYLDGYKVKFSIGNLTGATFNGAKINLAWGKYYQKSREVSFTNNFYPGRYTTVEAMITPAKPEDIREILLTLEFNVLGLR